MISARFKLLKVLFAILIAISFNSCDKDEVNSESDIINGIVLYMPPPDNCDDYVIKTDDNYLYKPSNLNDDLKTDSLLVRFAFNPTDNFHNCGFGGQVQVIDLTQIEKR